MLYSVFDFDKLDVLHNLTSVEECMKGIREFASLGDCYKEDMSNEKVCDIWGFAVFSHEVEITEPTRTSRKEIEDKYDINIIYDYQKTIEVERTRKLKSSMTAKELFEKVKDEIRLDCVGLPKMVTKKRTTILNTGGETMYGYIISWLKDYYSNERSIWDDTARLLIGDFVIHNSLL